MSAIISGFNSTSTLLGANATFDGTFYEDVSGVSRVTVAIHSDVDSAVDGFVVSWSSDGKSVVYEDRLTFRASTAGRGVILAPRARYFKVKYTNGPVGQNEFSLQTLYADVGDAIVTRSLTKPLDVDLIAHPTISILHGEAFETPGTFHRVKVNSQGELLTATSSTPTFLTDPVDRAARVLGHVVIDNFPEDPTFHVLVDNFPSDQLIHGNVSVTNFPLTQAVSGTVSVDNFPAFPTDQLVHGTVAVSNMIPAVEIGLAKEATLAGTLPRDVTDRAARLVGHVTVDNFPGTQPVSGTVAVSNFPADQLVHFASTLHTIVDSSPALTDAQLRASAVPVSVSGSVSVSNFPGDQLVHFSSVQHTIVDSSPSLTDAQLRASPVPVSTSSPTRTIVALTVDGATGPAVEALATLTINKGGVVTTGTSYTVSALKKFRIQDFSLMVWSANNTPAQVIAHLRAEATVTATSPIYMKIQQSSTTNIANAIGQGNLTPADGMEFAAGQQVGISVDGLINQGNSRYTLCVVGYEY